ncbi:MAG: hypothetical protein AAF184_12770 [Pseudomonadota bacterium]
MPLATHGRVFGRSVWCAAALIAVAAGPAPAQGDAKGQALALEMPALVAKLQAPALRAARERAESLAIDEAFDPAQMEALLSDPQFDGVGRDHLRLALVRAARKLQTPPSALEAYVAKLQAHEDEVLTVHQEGPLAIPYFAIANAAEGTLSLWERRRTAKALAGTFAQGEIPNFQAYFGEGAEDRSATAQRLGAMDALAAMPSAQLRAVGASWLKRADRSTASEAPLALIARKTADVSLFRELLSVGRTHETLALVGAVSTTLSPEDAFTALADAHGNPRFSSAALYALGDLVDRTPGVRDYLLQALADPTSGGSAAAVIAASGDRLLLDQVAARLAQDEAQDDRHRARLALTLRLAGTTAARQQLRAALAQGVITPPHLAEEVRAWLGE